MNPPRRLGPIPQRFLANYTRSGTWGERFDPRSKANVSEGRRNVTWVPWPIVAPIVAQTALQPEVAATSLPWLVTQCLAGCCRALHNATATALPATPTSDVAGANATAAVTFIVLRDVIRRINAARGPYVRDPVTCRPCSKRVPFRTRVGGEEINRATRDSPRVGVVREHERELPLATRIRTRSRCLVFVIVS